MGARWPLQKAKNEFSRVVDLALSEGPQTVTRHGELVVVISSVAGPGARKPDRRAAKALLALLRSCPEDLSRLTTRDKSGPRITDFG